MRKRLVIVAVVLFLTAGARVWLNAAAIVPPRQTLSSFPIQIGNWQKVREPSISDPVLGVLKADDYMLRTYKNAEGQEADVFVAYYTAQRAGETMHSPKNCLPGWGWSPIQNDRVQLQTAAGPVEVNRYVVEKDGQRAIVIYWYQEQGRVIASEYWGKLYLVWDGLRTRRRDGAIVRLTIPVNPRQPVDDSLKAVSELAAGALRELPRYLPN